MQAGGPGSAVHLLNSNLLPGREHLNVFSLEPCPGGPGSGSFAGLCATDPTFLVIQATLRLESPPFHFTAPGGTATFGPFTLPPLAVEAITVDLTGGQPRRLTSVTSVVLQ